MHALIERHHAAIVALCRRHDVRHLELFGSAARGEDFDPARSDVDFLVEFSQGRGVSPLDEFFGFRDELSRLLGCRVDLVEAGAVRNPYVKASIDRSRQMVYAA